MSTLTFFIFSLYIKFSFALYRFGNIRKRFLVKKNILAHKKNAFLLSCLQSPRISTIMIHIHISNLIIRILKASLIFFPLSFSFRLIIHTLLLSFVVHLYLPANGLICLLIYLSLYLSIFLSTHLSIYLSIYISIDLFISMPIKTCENVFSFPHLDYLPFVFFFLNMLSKKFSPTFLQSSIT